MACFLAVLMLLLPAASSPLFAHSARTVAELKREFAAPPDSARPWVYWFWKNGNITRDAITADLEAMRRVGVGGVILMEVALTVPQGPVPFFSDPWRKLFGHAVAEADRLGLKISINSAPGWTGSGGAWVTPEQSMQKVTASATEVLGPQRVELELPQPPTVRDFYRDIAVLAFPTPQGDYQIAAIGEKALYQRGPISSRPGVRAAFPSVADYPAVPPQQRIPAERIVDLSGNMDALGRLTWDVPAGNWTVTRFGHTSTGQTNRPAPSPGLECDKLSTKALDAHFRQFTARLLADAAERVGRSLVATHLDSWEVGAQNWTPGFREAFQKRRSYDPLRYLPVMTGRVVESLEISERFLWDLRQTVSEMIVENHGRHLHALAERHGLWLSIEPYDMTPCDDMTLGATADVPMCEFWSQGFFDTRYAVKEATSIGHVYGKRVVAAEAFTSGPTDAWRLHPATVKPLGDWAFCEGVNRLVVHRYVHQPFRQIRPGLSLGPHGLHYERTQTWWEWTGPWHTYLARCQHMMQQGRWIADLLYLSPEGAPNVFQSPRPVPEGYKFDACTPEALLTRVHVRDGSLVLPDGMSYRMLVLPEAETMTPSVLRKIKQLVEAGATVAGNPPRKSPSLAGYPRCDRQVQQLVAGLWGEAAPPATIGWRRVGQGRLVWGHGLKKPRQDAEDATDRVAQAHWIWHREGNPAAAAPVGRRYFRRLLQLEQSAEIESARAVMTADNEFELWINGRKAGEGDSFLQLYSMDIASLLRPGKNVVAVAADNGGNAPNPAGLLGSLSLQFRDGGTLRVHTDRRWQTTDLPGDDWRTAATADGWPSALELGRMGKAPWGTPGKVAPKHDVYPPSGQIVELLGGMGVLPDFAAEESLRYAHRRIAGLDAYFVSNGEPETVQGTCSFRVQDKRPELWHPQTGHIRPLPQYTATDDGRTVVPLCFGPGESYFVVFRRPTQDDADSEDRPTAEHNFHEMTPVMKVDGPWKVTFDPQRGGPDGEVTFEELADWAKRPEDAVRYYSGTAVYTKTVQVPADTIDAKRPLLLDLGSLQVMAEVKLNDQDLGILWKPPFCVDVRGAIRPGSNTLQVKVVNLWPNRMIGDAHLPEDAERRPGGTLERWPPWLLQGKPSPTGRYTFATWEPYNRDSQLTESGLLGPVTLQTTSNADSRDQR